MASCTTRSTVRAKARVATPAVGRSSTTASGVTTPARTVRRTVTDGDGHRPLHPAATTPSGDASRELVSIARRSGSVPARTGRPDDRPNSWRPTSGPRPSCPTSARSTATPTWSLRLSRLVGRVPGWCIYRQRGSPARAVARFFTEGFPAAVWVSRRYVAVAAACLLLPAVAMGVWLANDTAVLDASVDPALQRSLAESEFRDYYSSEAAQDFAGRVTVEQHRGLGDGLRPGARPGCGAGDGPGPQRAQHRRRRRRAPPRRGGTPVLGADHPPRAAGARGHRHRRRRRAAHLLGDRRPRRPHPGRGPRRGGAAVRGDRGGARAVLRHGRAHRGLRHPLGDADGAAGGRGGIGPGRLRHLRRAAGPAGGAAGPLRAPRRAHPRRPRPRRGRRRPGRGPEGSAAGAQRRPVAFTRR